MHVVMSKQKDSKVLGRPATIYPTIPTYTIYFTRLWRRWFTAIYSSVCSIFKSSTTIVEPFFFLYMKNVKWCCRPATFAFFSRARFSSLTMHAQFDLAYLNVISRNRRRTFAGFFTWKTITVGNGITTNVTM